MIFFKTSSRGPRGKFHPLPLQPEGGKPPKSIAVPLRGPCGGKNSYIPTPVGLLSQHAEEATNNLRGESPGGGERGAKRNVGRPGYPSSEKGLRRRWMPHGESRCKPTRSLNNRHQGSVLDPGAKPISKTSAPDSSTTLPGKFRNLHSSTRASPRERKSRSAARVRRPLSLKPTPSSRSPEDRRNRVSPTWKGRRLNAVGVPRSIFDLWARTQEAAAKSQGATQVPKRLQRGGLRRGPT